MDGRNYPALAWDMHRTASPCLISDWNFTPASYHGVPVKEWLASVSGPVAAVSQESALDRVFPRLFTPNGDGVNDVVFFDVVNPSLDNVNGKIFDVSGSPVADLKPAPPSGVLQPDSLMWDGKDGNGNSVRGGVYLYRIRMGEKVATGTVVVAK